jgi:hypothetical protein
MLIMFGTAGFAGVDGDIQRSTGASPTYLRSEFKLLSASSRAA